MAIGEGGAEVRGGQETRQGVDGEVVPRQPPVATPVLGAQHAEEDMAVLRETRGLGGVVSPPRTGAEQELENAGEPATVPRRAKGKRKIAVDRSIRQVLRAARDPDGRLVKYRGQTLATIGAPTGSLDDIASSR